MVQQNAGEALRAERKALKEVAQAVAELEGMNLAQLRERYLELFGEEARSKNLPYLRKHLAWRLQERVEGGLSPQALRQIEALAPAELPVKARRERPAPKASGSPAAKASPGAKPRDPRLPAAGTVLVREHGGFKHEVEVLEVGFRYRGRTYASLSTLAKEITGTAWNGFLFFGLTKRGGGHGR